MVRALILGLISLYSVVVFSYEEGRYSCKNNHVGLPDNTYVIKNVSVGADGDKLPFIEATRFFRKNLSDPNSDVVRSSIKGLATVFASNVLEETLTIGALRLEFSDEKMVGCIK